MSKVLRRRMVDELSVSLKDQTSLIVVDATGLTGTQADEIRAELRQSEGKFRHVKNSVALHACKKVGIEGLDEYLNGMTAFAFGADVLSVAKGLIEYKDKNKRPKVRGALIEGQLMNAAEVEQFSKLPSRDELLSILLGTLNAVTTKFVSTLNEIPRSFVGTLQAVADKDKKD